MRLEFEKIFWNLQIPYHCYDACKMGHNIYVFKYIHPTTLLENYRFPCINMSHDLNPSYAPACKYEVAAELKIPLWMSFVMLSEKTASLF